MEWITLASIVLIPVGSVIAHIMHTRTRIRLLELRVETIETQADQARATTAQLQRDLHQLVIELREFLAAEQVRRRYEG